MELNSVDIGIREVKTMATNCKLNCLQCAWTDSQGLGIGLQLCHLKSEYSCLFFFLFLNEPQAFLVLYFMLLAHRAGSSS